MSKNIVLEFKGKVDALIITPELGCCKKSTSYSDIIEILGEDHEKMIIGGMALFMAKNSASIPYNEIEENPTKLIYFDNTIKHLSANWRRQLAAGKIIAMRHPVPFRTGCFFNV